MNVGELIARLQEYDEKAEVRLAYQPSYPLQSSLRGVAGSDDQTDYDEDGGGDGGDGVVYLVEGGQCDHPYAPRWVWDAS